MGVQFDPLSRDWRDDPYPVYRRLRDEAPVHWAAEMRAWCVSRYDDVQYVLRNPEIFSSRAMFTVLMAGGRERPPINLESIGRLLRFFAQTRQNPLQFHKTRMLIASDGPPHAAMRNIVNRGFTPRRIADWEPRIREIAAACVGRLHTGEPFDLVHDLAVPLPVTVIAEMIGIEPARHADFKRWSDVIIRNSTGEGRSEPFNAEITDAVIELHGYLSGILKQRRDAPDDDLISAIVAGQDEADPLTDFEVVQFILLLMVAGNETTTNLIGNAVTALLDHPDELARACADASRIPAVVEETLRYDPPIQLLCRTATRDVELAGTRIPGGAWVVPLLGSANRDERQFDEPDRFDPEREAQGHVAFGFGRHFCLGASLARLEACAALEAILPELPDRRRVDAKPALVDSFLVRGPRRLELV